MSGYDLVRHQPKQDEAIEARVKKDGDSMTGDLKMMAGSKITTYADNNDDSVSLNIKDNDQARIRIGGTGAVSTNGLEIHSVNDKKLLRVDDMGEVYVAGVSQVYHPGNKPTPADIGAVNKTGDTMTGTLNFAAGNGSKISHDGESILHRYNNQTILGTNAGGNIILRPNGVNDNAKQVVIGANGDMSMGGTLHLQKTTDLSGTADNRPALIVGGIATGAHLELDGNEIHAKANGNTPADLFINSDGGKVFLGGGVGNCHVEGNTVTAPNIFNSTLLTTKNVTPYNNADGSIGTHNKRFASVWATTGMGVENTGNDQWCSYDAYRTINNTRYLARYGVGRTEADGVVHGCSGIEINVKPTQTAPTELKARVNLTSDKVFSPDLPSNIALGRRSVRWKEIWAGTDSNNENGYATLPNGYVIMWGTTVVNTAATEVSVDVTYPIKVTKPFRPVVSTEDLNGIMVSVFGTGNNNNFRLNFKKVAYAGAGNWQVRANWYCVGKI